MLVEANLPVMIVLVVLGSNGNRLLVDLVVKVEQILVHHVQEMRQASGLRGELVTKCTKRGVALRALSARTSGWMRWARLVGLAEWQVLMLWFLDGC